MPQVTTVDTQGWKGGEKWERGKKEGGKDDGEKKNEVTDRETEQERTEGAQRWSWTNLHWRYWPSWLLCLAQVTALWLVVQEEAPLHPSISLLEVGFRLLLAGLLWTGFGLCISLLQLLYHYKKKHKQEIRGAAQNTEVSVREQEQQVCPFSQQYACHLVPMVSALLDGLVVSLIQESLSDTSLPRIRVLLNRLEAVSQAVSKCDLLEGQFLQASDEEDRMSVEESLLKDRVKHICTYLQDRMSALHSLLQVQDQYGVFVSDVQQSLQEHWELLENLHTRVTLQSEKCLGTEDPHAVLSDTESLYTQLGLFRKRVHECQTHLNTSTHLLQEMDNSQQVLAETVGVTLESTWTKDFLQCNTQQFEKVHQKFLSLEQQTLTFVMHLRGLKVSEEETISSSDQEHMQSHPSSPFSAVPVYSTPLATERPDPDPIPEVPPRSHSKLLAINCLRGVKRRK